jgi:hypothetical protein
LEQAQTNGAGGEPDARTQEPAATDRFLANAHGMISGGNKTDQIRRNSLFTFSISAMRPGLRVGR